MIRIKEQNVENPKQLMVRWHHILPERGDQMRSISLKKRKASYIGKTVAKVYIDDVEVSVGEALLSVKDQFNRKIGRRLAVNRALDNLLHSDKGWLIPKELRKAFWEEYHKTCKD